MASVFFKEIRKPGKNWERVTLGKDRQDVEEAVKTSQRCNKDDEHRVAEYARVDSQRWFLQFENTPPTDTSPASWRAVCRSICVCCSREWRGRRPAARPK